MDLEAGLEPEPAPNLILGQGAGSVSVDGQHFKGVAFQVSPPAFQSSGDVVWHIERDAHQIDCRPGRLDRAAHQGVYGSIAGLGMRISVI
jgi:hypothetical protein